MVNLSKKKETNAVKKEEVEIAVEKEAEDNFKSSGDIIIDFGFESEEEKKVFILNIIVEILENILDIIL